ncbi:hypothetical protein NLI96_g10630 [Meripilus lineatus]|uniref:EamA domain-containing protein n=1 Tax=Meripilus lineatus TaxID=2056292 RepID=A0AAD5UVM8_9APHY|nr:hypothetical protein NLI96_g10630 [Physisporinus lineatus]
MSPTSLQERRNYLIGICLLLVVVLLWTSSNFLTQGLFDEGYDKPFLITYLSTCTFSLYLLPFLARSYIAKRNGGNGGDTRAGYQPLGAEPNITDSAEHPNPESNRHDDELPPLTTTETAKLALYFCLLWFVANWALNTSLGYTSVASATILSSMSGFFTLGIGRLFRVETLTLVKIAAVATSFGGVLLVSLSDSSQGGNKPIPPSPSTFLRDSNTVAPIWGDVLSLLSALCYAFYVILLKVQIKEESRIDVQLFFGFVGLFNMVGIWPIGLILHLTGIEPFGLPQTGKATAAILINMAITLSSDYIYVLAMLKTTPLVVTVGLSLTMPLAVVGDFILHKPTKLQVILGAALVLLSFVAIGLEDSNNKEEDDLIAGRPLEEVGSNAVRLEEEVVLESQEEHA